MFFFLFCFFFSNRDFPCVATFQDNFMFGEVTFFTLFQSDSFDTAVTFSEQIFFQSSCFFLLFQNSHFSQQFFFSEWLLFQNETFTEQAFLENEKFFTAVTFRNSCFSMFRIKISKKELLFKAGTNFFRKATF